MKIGKIIVLAASLVLVTQVSAATSVSSAPVGDYPIHAINYNNLGATPVVVTETLYIGNGSGQACTAAQQESTTSVTLPGRRITQRFVQGDRLASHGLKYTCVLVKITTPTATIYDGFAIHADRKKYDSATPNSFDVITS